MQKSTIKIVPKQFLDQQLLVAKKDILLGAVKMLTATSFIGVFFYLQFCCSFNSVQVFLDIRI
jgi:hypothetical protein